MRNIEVKKQIDFLEKEVVSIQSRCSLLNEQYTKSEQSFTNLKLLQITNEKAIELLHLVKRLTEDRIKGMFEQTISYALQYIYQSDDYKFQLDFDRKGSLPTLNFRLKRPELQESHNILHTSAGGSRDVIALALRFVILEVSKMPGFLFLDEPEKRLDNPETMTKMIQFIKEMQERTHRQILIITHKQEFVDVVPNPIILLSKTKSKQCEISQQKEIEEPQKKSRGRPKKRRENV